MADIRYCMKCMQPGNSDICPNCGYKKGSQVNRNYCLPEGTQLNDRYIIGCLLGSGGFGNTYIACDTLFERKVAVKEYLPSEMVSRTEMNPDIQVKDGEFSKSFEDGRRKFIKEARILSSLKNEKGIVDVIDYFKANNTAYLVMEYLEGMSLAQYIKSRPKGRIPEKDALLILLPVFDVTEAVHGMGLLHRDISPENIILSKDGVKLIDFGASREFTDTGVTKTIIVKHGYAPPEQYSRSGRQGAWSDVYALAATYYKSITGITPPDPFSRMQGEKIKTFRECSMESPNEPAIMKAMELNIADRYASIREFRKNLEQPAVKTKTKRHRVRTAIMIAAAVLFILAATGFAADRAIRNGREAGIDESTATPSATPFESAAPIESPDPTAAPEPEDEKTPVSGYTGHYFTDVGQVPDIDKVDYLEFYVPGTSSEPVTSPEPGTIPEPVTSSEPEVRPKLFSDLHVTMRSINHNRIPDQDNGTVELVVGYPEGSVIRQYRVGEGEWIDYTGPLVFDENVYVSTRAYDAVNDIITGGAGISMPENTDTAANDFLVTISGNISGTGHIGEKQVLVRVQDGSGNQIGQAGNNSLDLQPGITSYELGGNFDIDANAFYSFFFYVDVNRNYLYDPGECYTSVERYYYTEASGISLDLTEWNDVAFISSALIPDVKLNEYLWDLLGRPGRELTEEDLSGVTYINVNDIGIASIEGLQYCTDMEIINIANNSVSDIGPLAGLSKIRDLTAGNNNISDITVLAGFPLLEHLALNNNPIRDISPLANLENINYLELTHTYISDLAPLEGMVNLERLYLWNSPVVDISPLAGCVKLRELYLDNTNVTDYSALSGITTLEEFEVTRANEGYDFDLIDPPDNIGTTVAGQKSIRANCRRVPVTGNYRVVLEISDDETGETHKADSGFTELNAIHGIADCFFLNYSGMTVGRTYSYRIFVDFDNDLSIDPGEYFAGADGVMYRGGNEMDLYFYDWSQFQ